MIKIAFVYTEYQQNILFSLCHQKRIKIDYLVLKKDTKLSAIASLYIKKVIYYENVPNTLYNIYKYYIPFFKDEIRVTIKEKNIKIFTWTILHPLVRLSIHYSKKVKINIIEDGTGSYINWGNINLTNLKANFFLLGIASFYSNKIRFIKEKKIISWSLFEGAFPTKKYLKKRILPASFETIVEQNLIYSDLKVNKLKENSIIFITSPYVENKILNEDEYIQSFYNAINKIKQDIRQDVNHIYLKIHPRNNIQDEIKRISIIKKQFNIEIALIDNKINIEYIAYYNKKNNIRYYSIGSTALYVLKVLSLPYNSVTLINDRTFFLKYSFQKQLVNIFRKIGIRIIE